jgi:hypothetical protein
VQASGRRRVAYSVLAPEHASINPQRREPVRARAEQTTGSRLHRAVAAFLARSLEAAVEP